MSSITSHFACALRIFCANSALIRASSSGLNPGALFPFAPATTGEPACVGAVAGGWLLSDVWLGVATVGFAVDTGVGIGAVAIGV